MSRFLIILFAAMCFCPKPAIAASKFSVKGDTIVYDTVTDNSDIDTPDIDELKAILLKNKNIKKIILHSYGGFIGPARNLADLIVDAELDTLVIDECASACVYLFLAGNNRGLELGGKIGFHQSSWGAASMKEYYLDAKDDEGWKDEFEFASWALADTQADIVIDFEYYLERGVKPKFIIKTLQATSDEMWYPRRQELLDAGVITPK